MAILGDCIDTYGKIPEDGDQPKRVGSKINNIFQKVYFVCLIILVYTVTRYLVVRNGEGDTA